MLSVVPPIECDDRECEKHRSRQQSTIWMLRTELEAARVGIEELEREIEIVLSEVARLEASAERAAGGPRVPLVLSA